jgi:CubicO group peptidase (beta-lactamase class C family)
MIVVDRSESARRRIAAGLLAAAFGLTALGRPPARADEPPRRLRPGEPHAHGMTDKDLDAVRAILRGAVADKVVPGISLLVAHRGEVIFKEAYGDLKVDQKVQMASSAKSVTATLLMILVERCMLS